MTVPAAPGRSSWCDACMGSRRCWVCDGAGSVERRYAVADCPSCRATGACRYCAHNQPQPAATVLDPLSEPAAAASTEGSAQG